MEKEEESGLESAKGDRRVWLGVGVLLLVCGCAIVEVWWSNQRIPTSGGMTVSEWLYAKDTSWGSRSYGSSNETVVLGFGEQAIPYFEREWRGASPSQDEQWKLIREWANKVKIELDEHADWQSRGWKARWALSVLGRKYPDQVTPVFMGMLGTSNHLAALYGLGDMGTLHFAFLTNMVATSSLTNADAAISALSAMGTNADSAVPLVVKSIRKSLSTKGRYWGQLISLARIGEGSAEALNYLFECLEDPDPQVRKFSAAALGTMTNSYDRIIPEILRVARLPITNGVDYGERPTAMLWRLGVPPSEAMPLLLRRIRAAIEAEKYDPAPSPGMVRYYVTRAAWYGAAAKDVIPLIDTEFLRRARVMPGASGGGFGRGSSPADAWIDQMRRDLLRIDPSWTEPEAK